MQETEDVYGDDSDELQAKKPPAFWRKSNFREIYVPLAACIILLTAAILLRLYKKHMVYSTASRYRDTSPEALNQHTFRSSAL